MNGQALTIDLLRHGEPEGGNQFRGSKDDPLSELGWQQMHSSHEHFSGWTSIVSSPMLRCCEFARRVNDTAKDVELIADFREIHLGDWEGLTADEVENFDPETIHQFWTQPSRAKVPNGEPMADFQQRVTTAWSSLLKDTNDDHVLLVCHGGVIRVILSQVLDVSLDKLWHWDVPYASLSRIRIFTDKKGQPRQHLVFHNASNRPIEY